MTPSVAPEALEGWMRHFRCHFTAAAWRHVLVLVGGALLAPGRRTVAAALRVMGLSHATGFAVYHRVLSRGHWCSRAVAHRLLLLPVAAFAPDGPVVVGLDDTIERRWGAKIKARGIYRDPVRSSHGHFVKASGLRWLCVMLLAPVPWAGCVWGLPFLTVLAPSERYAAARDIRFKKLTDWGRQALLQVARWLPGRRVIAVADSSFSAIALLRDLAPHLTVITRLRLDACLCHPPPPRRPGAIGRPPVKGARLPSLAQRLRDPATPWRRITLDGWYGHATRRLDIASGTALWHHPGMRVAIRWGSGHAPNGARPHRREGAAGLPLHRPASRTGRHPALVRPPLAHRDDIRRGQAAPRRGDPAPVVRPRHPAHHARAARAVLPRDAVGGPTRRRTRTSTRPRRLVPETAAHLQRCSRPRPA
jgi:DDE superfamily endonuclease